ATRGPLHEQVEGGDRRLSPARPDANEHARLAAAEIPVWRPPEPDGPAAAGIAHGLSAGLPRRITQPDLAAGPDRPPGQAGSARARACRALPLSPRKDTVLLCSRG